MKRKIFFVLVPMFAIITATTYFSCKKANFGEQQSNILKAAGVNVSVKNSFLVFGSMADFEAAIIILHKNQSTLDVSPPYFEGFTSQRKKYLELVDRASTLENSLPDLSQYESVCEVVQLNGEQLLEPEVDSHLLSYLTSEDGIIQIGNEAYFLNYDHVYEFPSTELESLDLNKINVSNIQGLKVYDIARHSEMLREEIRTCENIYTSNKKLRGEMTTTNTPPIYSDIVIRTKSRKKTLGIWLDYKVNNLYCDGAGTYLKYFLGLPSNETYAVNESKSNVADIQQTINSCIGVDCTYYFVTGSNTHRLQENSGGSYKYCYTNYP
ncbi:MAG: hypothetical protein LH473_03905 [Chitinophagales bacterium]|nr:hypothetical protein [Chitinophagales bacterium]